MEENQNSESLIIKREISILVIKMLFLLFYAVISIILSINLKELDNDFFIIIIIIVSIIYVFIFLKEIIKYFSQPSQVIYTKNNKVIVEKFKESVMSYDRNEITEKLYKKDYKRSMATFMKITGSIIGFILYLYIGPKIIFSMKLIPFFTIVLILGAVVMIMGFIPGIVLNLLTEKYEFKIETRDKTYTFYISFTKQLSKFVEVLENNSNINFINKGNEIINRVTKWRNNASVRKEWLKVTKIILITLVITLILSIVTIYFAKRIDKNFANGLGSKMFPYIIETEEQWEYFAKRVNEKNYDEKNYFALGNNIDFGGKEITPIGKHMGVRFKGKLDGRGHIIRNFQIPVTEDETGIFVYSSGEIRRLGVDNLIIFSKEEDAGFYIRDIGAFIVENYGLIENCYIVNSEVNVYSNSVRVSAFAFANSGKIVNCFSDCNIDAKADDMCVVVSGFVGVNRSKGLIKNCFTVGNMKAVFYENEKEFCTAYTYFPSELSTGNYYYEGQIITRIYGDDSITTNEPSFDYGDECSLDQLNDKYFYLDILKWSEKIWDFSDLDMEVSKFPTLKR